MTHERRTIIETEAPPTHHIRESEVVVERTAPPSGGDMLRRTVIFLFGIVQGLIILRIILLLLDAREGNAIVTFILDTSQIFVGPFEGILQTDALASGGSVLDMAAVVALIGWTVIEALILGVASLVSRDARA